MKKYYILIMILFIFSTIHFIFDAPCYAGNILPKGKHTHGSIKKDVLDTLHVPEVLTQKDEQGIPITGQGIKVAVIDYWALDSWITMENDRVIDIYNAATDSDGIADGSTDHGNTVAKAILDVAPNAQILAHTLERIETDWDFDESIRYSLKQSTQQMTRAVYRAIKKKAHIINICVGTRSEGYNPEDPLIIAIEKASRKGIAVVVAAGNDGQEGRVNRPATSPSVISVGATCEKGRRIASYSSYGPIPETWEMKPDIVAPGVYCKGIWKHQGTSYATPYVSGCIALLMQAHPDWKVGDIKSALALSATSLGGDIHNFLAQGSGQIDVSKALKTSTFISPTHLSFYQNLSFLDRSEISCDHKTIYLENRSSEEKTYHLNWEWNDIHNGIEMEISRSSIKLAPNTMEPISIKVKYDNTAQLGLYTENIIITTDTENWRIPVLTVIQMPPKCPVADGFGIILSSTYLPNHLKISFGTYFYNTSVDYELFDSHKQLISNGGGIFQNRESTLWSLPLPEPTGKEYVLIMRFNIPAIFFDKREVFRIKLDKKKQKISRITVIEGLNSIEGRLSS